VSVALRMANGGRRHISRFPWASCGAWGLQIQDSKFKIQEFRIQDSESRGIKANRKSAIEIRQSQIEDPKLANGNGKSKIQNRRSGMANPKSKIENPKSTIPPPNL
jgi:hypothetical protein